MSDIRQWLEQLGLGQYGDAFEANRIGLDMVSELGHDILKDIGVRAAGDRIVILRAARSTASEAAADPEAAYPAETDKVKARVASEAERRQITVLFSDLVGSTALSTKLDPEDLRDVMAAYQGAAGAVVERYAGHIAQYLGDGLMIYFGWPKAHEDDAQRAVRAGLEIVEAVRKIRGPVTLSVRVGIATGPVVVGKTGGDDASVPEVAVGETPNVAVRFQGLAKPNTVIIGESTRRLIGGAFDLDDLGTEQLKGVAAPMAVYRVTGESAVETRFEATHTAGLTPMVGREAEIAMLMDRWAQAKGGEGQVVLLSGEAGIGKSRIAQVLQERVANEPHTRLRYQCSSYYTNSAFYPLIDQLESAAGFGKADTPDTRLDKLERLLTQSSKKVGEVAPLFAAMLSLPLDRYPPLNLSPQKQKENTIAALADQPVGLAERAPVLMIFEDAQWVDPTTLELLGEGIDRFRDVRVLLVITSRPEFEPPWSGHSHITSLTLNRLSRQHCAAMVAGVTGGKRLPDDVLDHIIAKTDGVPLFVEEVTKTVLDSAPLKETADGYVLDGRLPERAIPSTLQNSLMARLDRLATAKSVAQIGAVIGRRFRYAIVAEVLSLSSDELAHAFGRLVATGLVSRRGSPPEAVYTFKHALFQDAAYESMLRSKRQAFHRRIAEVLSDQFPETGETQPEVLARHYAAGQVNEKAVRYLLRAGQNAWRRSAAREASEHLTRGLDLVGTIGDVAQREALELQLQSTLGLIHFTTAGYASAQAEAAYSKAHELCERVDDAELQIPVLYGVGAFLTMKGDADSGHDAFEKLMAVGKASDQLRFRLHGHAALAWSNYNRAHHQLAIEHADQVLALYGTGRPAGPRMSAADPKVIGECFRAMAQWSLGFPDQASETSDALLEHARTLGDPYSLVYTLNFAALLVAEVRGEVELVFDRAGEGIELARDRGYPFMEVSGSLWKAWAMSKLGDPVEALALEQDSLEKYRKFGTLYNYAYWSARLAMALVRAGHTDHALAVVGKVLALLEKSVDRFAAAEILRTTGDVLRSTGEDRWSAAEANYLRAVDVARAQKAKSWELRAATSLARLWHSQEKTKEARDLLAPIYHWFTEGFDTADLKEAKALLEELK